ncbi:MAG TPA: hypothetical protein VK459_16995, partial [Polyangiaceae bacterium]|nr:hypothetical protein [Polyangiaceae bacterium]
LRIVPMGMKGGLGRFAIVKSADGAGFEEWYIDANWLRIRSDTTWAYERSPGGAWCDVKCGDNTFDNCQQRWNTNSSDPLNGLNPSSPWALTTYHEPGNEALAAAFIERRMALPIGGERRFTTSMEIKGADRNTCGGCWVNFGTKDGQSVSRTVVARRYGSWNGFSDVVHLRVESGPGAGENCFYAYGKGWVGFNDKVASNQVDSATLPQSSCMSFQQGSVCEAVGKPGEDPPAQPPPSGDGTCDCQGGVDNFCLYAASTPDCGMTAPGGYCDPNADGDFGDADWVRGYNEYKEACSGGSPPPPPPACECKSGVDNFCLYPAKTSGCEMTMPGGYCDPNGDGSFDDANWEKGYYDYHAACP